ATPAAARGNGGGYDQGRRRRLLVGHSWGTQGPRRGSQSGWNCASFRRTELLGCSFDRSWLQLDGGETWRVVLDRICELEMLDVRDEHGLGAAGWQEHDRRDARCGRLAGDIGRRPVVKVQRVVASATVDGVVGPGRSREEAEQHAVVP